MFAKSSGFFKDSCLKAALVATAVRSEAQQATVIVSPKIPRIGIGLCAFRRPDFVDVKYKSPSGHMIRSHQIDSRTVTASIDAET
jgi:hypothetical protein